MSVPEPAVTWRGWSFTYTRPRRMGWPNLDMTDLPATSGYPGRKGTPLAPRKITVGVRQRSGDLPELTAISVSGTWARTGREVTGKKIHFDDPPGLALVIYATDWVMELADDAVRRARDETGHGE